MLHVRIVCTHDGVKTAQTLARLLSAEEYAVEVCYGRHSVDLIAPSREAREAVVLIWSMDAPSATYMLTWAQDAEPSRLIEIARGPVARRQHAVDFSAWGGERGGPAWRTLTDRLRTIARGLEPKRPQPVRAAMALGAASMLAVGVASFERVHTAYFAPTEAAPEETQSAAAQQIDSEGRGGAIEMVEPASISEEAPIHFGPYLHARPLDAVEFEPLAEPATLTTIHLREPNLRERLSEMAAPIFASLDRKDD